jgi:E3 ubiquitin-protein ligase RNF14
MTALLQYHGTKSRCVFNQASTIIDKYVNGTEKEQADLEIRYGKTNVKKLVEMYLEEQANARWIESNTTRCPDCSLDVERSFGCAHMVR